MIVLVLVLTFVLLFVLGVPIAFCLGLSTLATMLMTMDFAPAVTTIAQRMAGGVNSFALLAIPLFILSGQLMAQGGIARRIIDFSKALIGSVPGGLAFVNVISCALFGAISGSAVAATSAIGGFMIPEMNKEGYDRDFNAAVTATASTSGMLIPPSNILIVYAVASGGVSIAALFIAGYAPGILLAVSIMVVCAVYARRHGFPAGARVPLPALWKCTVAAVPSLFLIVLVIGGILGGIFTATEAGVVAVVIHQPAAQNAGHLVDPVGHQEPAVEDRNLRLGLGQPVSVDVNDAAHAPILSSSAPKRRFGRVHPGLVVVQRMVAVFGQQKRPVKIDDHRALRDQHRGRHRKARPDHAADHDPVALGLRQIAQRQRLVQRIRHPYP